MEWVGYLGVAAFALAWIPQSLETIKAGVCRVNLSFLLLSALGSLSLMAYAMALHDKVFMILNFLTSIGALINVYYRLAPSARKTS